MPLWTAIVRCKTCGTEINRAEHVPENKKTQIATTAPIAAGLCPTKEHNSFSDCTWNIDVEWVEELPSDRNEA